MNNSEKNRIARKEYNRKYSKSEKGKLAKEKVRCKNFNLSIEEFHNMEIAQNYSCLICGKKQNELEGKIQILCIDHDHNTGKIRGLLCHRCNVGLGMFLDSQEILINALSYLRERS